jgi:hypothetical protein
VRILHDAAILAVPGRKSRGRELAAALGCRFGRAAESNVKSNRSRPAAMRRAQGWQPGRASGLLVMIPLLACVGAAWAAAPAANGADAAPVRAGSCRSLAGVPYTQPVFLGYACRDRECNAHKAGFAWAERNGVTDAAECAASPNPAFVEGCRAYADESVTPEQAGFEWARENELDDACRCRGGGTGFEAGCAAYVVETGR